jgi:hypothetical protein
MPLGHGSNRKINAIFICQKLCSGAELSTWAQDELVKGYRVGAALAGRTSDLSQPEWREDRNLIT